MSTIVYMPITLDDFLALCTYLLPEQDLTYTPFEELSPDTPGEVKHYLETNAPGKNFKITVISSRKKIIVERL